MKKAGTIALIAVTLACVAFTAGVLVGRSTNRHSVSVQIPQNSASTTATLAAATNGLSHYTDSGLLNINTATAEELDSLPGIGLTLAQRIIEYREENGPFRDVSALSAVEGIGSKKMLAIMELITVEE